MRNITLDILKLISVFCVVFIHFTFLDDLGFVVLALARYAVPFFFICSGYYAANNDKVKIRKKIVKLLGIFCLSLLLYLLYFFINEPNRILHIPNIIEFIMYNVTEPAYHLWFLLALIYNYILKYIVVSINLNVKKSILLL